MDRHMKKALKAHQNSWPKLVYSINQALMRRGEPMITQQAVQKWARQGVPPSRAFILELATDGKVRAQDIIKEAGK